MSTSINRSAFVQQYYGIHALHQSEEIESIKVPVQDEKKPGGIGVCSLPIVHPHRILSYLLDDVKIQLPNNEISEYWCHARQMGEPWATRSPATMQHVPVGIHGDAARTWTQYKFEKIVSIFINLPLFRPRSMRHSRWIVFSCPHHLLFKNRTMNVVLRRLCWSLNAAFAGINPLVGAPGFPLKGGDLQRAGKPLTLSGHKFAVTELRGDWEWHRDIWRPTASWQAIDICFKCPAVSKGNPNYFYYNHGPNCAWEREEFGLEQFISRRLKHNNLCTQKKNQSIFFNLFCVINFALVESNVFSGG